MTMGLILLAVMAIVLMFPFGRNAFRGLGLAQWAGFLVIIAFAIGIIVPNIRLSEMTRVSVGGFILPIIASIVLAVMLARNNALLRGIVAMLAVVALTTGLLLVMPTRTMGLRVLTSIVIGIIAGAVGFIIGRTRSASVFSVLSGVAVGNLIYSLIDYFFISGSTVILGSSVVYNAIFVSVLFALVVAEASVVMERSGSVRYRRRNTNFEFSEDRRFDEPVAEDRDYESLDDDIF